MFKKRFSALAVCGALLLTTGFGVLAQDEAGDEAEQSIKIDVEATGGITRDGYISELTIGSMIAEGVHVSLNGSLNQEGFSGGSATFKADAELFSLETKGKYGAGGSFAGAEFKGQATLTDQISMSGRGSMSDTEFNNGVLSFTESMSGLGLKLDTMWSGEGFDTAALSGKTSFDLYTVTAKVSGLMGDAPTLNASIGSQTEPVAFSWNSTITMDGLQQQTIGATTSVDDVGLSGSVSMDGSANITMMTAGAKLAQSGLSLDGNVGFTFEGYQNATVKFGYGSEDPSVSAEGEFKFDQSGLASGKLDAQIGVADGWTLLSNAALGSDGLQQANVGLQTMLAGANTRAMMTLTPEGYAGSSLFVQYPWEGYTFTGQGRFDTEGHTLLQLTVNTSFDLM